MRAIEIRIVLNLGNLDVIRYIIKLQLERKRKILHDTEYFVKNFMYPIS